MLLDVNGMQCEVAADPDELLVWVIHEKLGLTKTRFGCGIAMCGACKILVDGQVTQSCTIKVKDVQGKKITTREVLPEEIFSSP
jgi:isoquinoline 1-oxidoreductase subunit alpha